MEPLETAFDEDTPKSHWPKRDEDTPKSHWPKRDEDTPKSHWPKRDEDTPNSHWPKRDEDTPNSHCPKEKPPKGVIKCSQQYITRRCIGIASVQTQILPPISHHGMAPIDRKS